MLSEEANAPSLFSGKLGAKNLDKTMYENGLNKDQPNFAWILFSSIYQEVDCRRGNSLSCSVETRLIRVDRRVNWTFQ